MRRRAAADKARRDKIAAGKAPRDKEDGGEILVLDVFELSSCGYCKDFRRGFAPRLQKDFPSVPIRYHDAAAVNWVERTPTILIGGELAFEGLPGRYKDLAQAVGLSLEQASRR